MNQNYPQYPPQYYNDSDDGTVSETGQLESKIKSYLNTLFSPKPINVIKSLMGDVVVYGTAAALLYSSYQLMFAVSNRVEQGFISPGASDLMRKATNTSILIGASTILVLFAAGKMRRAINSIRIGE